MTPSRRTARGVSMVELMLVLTLLGIILAASSETFLSGLGFYRMGEKRLEAVESLSILLRAMRPALFAAVKAPGELWAQVDPMTPPSREKDSSAATRLISFLDEPPTLIFFVREDGNLVRRGFRFDSARGGVTVFAGADHPKTLRVPGLMGFTAREVEIPSPGGTTLKAIGLNFRVSRGPARDQRGFDEGVFDFSLTIIPPLFNREFRGNLTL